MKQFGVKQSVNEVGEEKKVPPDGSCGFNAAIKGMNELGHKIPEDVTEFRHGLREYLKENIKCIDKLIHIGQSGKKSPDFKFGAKNTEKIMQKIYSESVDYNQYVGQSHWMDTMEVLPLIASKYQISIVCYGKESNTNWLSTTLCNYSADKERVELYSVPSCILCPPQGSLRLIHNGGDHYNYLDHKEISETVNNPDHEPIQYKQDLVKGNSVSNKSLPLLAVHEPIPDATLPNIIQLDLNFRTISRTSLGSGDEKNMYKAIAHDGMPSSSITGNVLAAVTSFHIISKESVDFHLDLMGESSGQYSSRRQVCR
jgi:hypothetical protein